MFEPDLTSGGSTTIKFDSQLDNHPVWSYFNKIDRSFNGNHNHQKKQTNLANVGGELFE